MSNRDEAAQPTTVGAALRAAAIQLEQAGVASPLVDARLLIAWRLGVDASRLFFHTQDPVPEKFWEDVDQRCQRVPLQHIMGIAPFCGLELEVGPGAFIPRPETELLVEWTLLKLEKVDNPVVVDLCSGPGTIALAIKHARPDAEVYGVEKDVTALSFARRNAERLGLAVTFLHGDVTAGVEQHPELVALAGRADAVVSNPPYVPPSTVVDPEVHADPPHAVFADDGGMRVITGMLPLLATLAKAGAIAAIEHDDATGQQVISGFSASGVWAPARQQKDLNCRDRFVTTSKL